jgi:hypothetical protein
MNDRVVYICSDVRSGSTLLDMLLGRHSQLKSVGELHHLYDYLNGTYYRQKTKEDKCTCGKNLQECVFWSKLSKEYKLRYKIGCNITPTRFPIPKSVAKRFLFDIFIASVGIEKFRHKIINQDKYCNSAKIALNRFKIYSVINDISKSSFVVDSSKKIEGLKFLLASKQESVKVIFLIRDLRAIAVSKFKRQAGSKLSLMMLQTAVFHVRLFIAIKTVPPEQKLIIKYDDLITNTNGVLKHIFTFLGISSTEEIDLQSYCESHILGGSPHRLTNKNLKIFVDDRWKKSITLLTKPISIFLVLIQKIFSI